ncbi:Mobile element protein [Cystobacter fuscus DSM 2262]|uniref:Mobile element protein n=1 Tax=Cystobacter fuscus (strain ATCC 25194 / DSM 2262 / NBRC 100088 / M29) TaxID=1242864 RepID=S9PCB0_CYSF2|nr:Mobile element protein [Cystobacter fuscus DSM 2262]
MMSLPQVAKDFPRPAPWHLGHGHDLRGARQGWPYLAVVLELFSREVVGGSMRQNIDRRLVLGALDMALQSRHSLGPSSLRPLLFPRLGEVPSWEVTFRVELPE